MPVRGNQFKANTFKEDSNQTSDPFKKKVKKK